jgi:hypothetical protein
LATAAELARVENDLLEFKAQTLSESQARTSAIERLRLEMKGDTAELHKKVNTVGTQVSGSEEKTNLIIERLRLEIKGDTAELHEKVNSVGTQVSGIEEKTNLMNQLMARLSDKLDRIAER